MLRYILANFSNSGGWAIIAVGGGFCVVIAIVLAQSAIAEVLLADWALSHQARVHTVDIGAFDLPVSVIGNVGDFFAQRNYPKFDPNYRLFWDSFRRPLLGFGEPEVGLDLVGACFATVFVKNHLSLLSLSKVC